MNNLHIKLAAHKSKLTGLLLSAAGILAFGGEVSAQTMDMPSGYASVFDIPGVINARPNADGSLTLTFDDGRVIDILPEAVMMNADQILINIDIVEAMLGVSIDGGGLSPVLMIGGLLAVTGAGVAAFAGDDEPDNVAPIFSSSQSVDFAENATEIVYTAAASDANGDALTYALSGTDAGLFSVNATTGAVSFNSTPDFESPGDNDGDNDYEITVTASDGFLTTTRDVTISVTNENDNAPVFTSGTTAIASENDTDADYTAVASDADGDTLTYSIVGGADAALFVIDSTTGVLTFIAGQDFEAPGDANSNNEFEVMVEVSDGTNTDTQTITVILDNDNDEAPVFTSADAFTIAENGTAIGYTAAATDADGSVVSFSISGGADAGVFAIDSAGVLTFIGAPDFEAPGDSGANNVYDVEITADDGVNTTVQTVAVTVTNLNDNAPVFTSGTAISVSEGNVGTSYTAVAGDADGDTLTYSIMPATGDGAAFVIDSNTGVLSFVSALDFETPTDGNTDNDYDVTIVVSDGVNSSTQIVTVSVTNINDVAPVFTSSNSASVAENSTATGYTAIAADLVEGDPVEYFISGGADANLFSINATTGVLSFVSAPDFDNPTDTGGNNVYDVEITATDGQLITPHSVAITVTDVNDEAPVFLNSSTLSVDENLTATGYTAAISDADGGAPTFTISGGADAALFVVNSTTGALSFVSSPDFENPTDVGGNNVYDVEITANDGVNSTAQSVAVTVDDVAAEAPIFSSAAVGTADENGVVTDYTAAAVDPNGNAVTFSIGGGADASLFSINATTGVLSFVTAPDFENPTDSGGNNIYDVEIAANDGTDTSVQAVAISINDINDTPPVITTPANISVEENSTIAFTATSTDVDGGTITYSLSGGSDAAQFTINANTGVVTFNANPDFEAPTDGNTNNDYQMTVHAHDGIFTSSSNVTVTVTDGDDGPEFQITGITMNEGLTITGIVGPATDQDGDAITYSLNGGDDAQLFTINSATGELSFIGNVDFEAPTDTGGDNTYEVIVNASSTTFSEDQLMSVTVANVNEAPEVIPLALAALETLTVPESNPFARDLDDHFTDVDGDALTYTLSGPDGNLFQIDANNVLTPITQPDFENPIDTGGDNVYDFTVTASDGSLSTSITSQYTVLNNNDTPTVFTSGTTANTLENAPTALAPGVLHVPAYAATAVDPDGFNVSYTISGGADAALFVINSNTGAVNFIASPDFENPLDAGANNVYDIEITARTNAADTVTQSVAITVDDVSTLTWSSGTVAYQMEARDGIGYPSSSFSFSNVAVNDTGALVSYSIVGGADASQFIVAASGPYVGSLINVGRADFESPTDFDGDGVYEVLVEATDGTNTISQTIFVTITDLNDLPTVTSVAPTTIQENAGAAFYTVTATDQDGQTLSYSLDGTARHFFAIDSQTGVITPSGLPLDFEANLIANNNYQFHVRVSDGINIRTQSFSVQLVDVNDNAPVFTSGAAQSVQENTLSTGYFAQATDADVNDTVTYSIHSGADASLFTINATTGELSFITAPDFEAPTDAGGNNQYDLNILATDGSNGTTTHVRITVTDDSNAARPLPDFKGKVLSEEADMEMSFYDDGSESYIEVESYYDQNELSSVYDVDIGLALSSVTDLSVIDGNVPSPISVPLVQADGPTVNVVELNLEKQSLVLDVEFMDEDNLNGFTPVDFGLLHDIA